MNPRTYFECNAGVLRRTDIALECVCTPSHRSRVPSSMPFAVAWGARRGMARLIAEPATSDEDGVAFR